MIAIETKKFLWEREHSPQKIKWSKINQSIIFFRYNPSILQSVQVHSVDIVPGNGLCGPRKNNVSAEAKRIKRPCA